MRVLSAVLALLPCAAAYLRPGPLRSFEPYRWATDLECTARGLKAPLLGEDLEVRDAPGKGVGVYAKRDLPIGTFVGRYTGILRARPDVVFALREKLTSGLYVAGLLVLVLVLVLARPVGLARCGTATRIDTPPPLSAAAALASPSRTAERYVMKLDSGVCVDAEFAERAEGAVRYVNHSLLRRNCELKALARPLFAGTVYLQTDFPIKAGDELLYNYGRAYWESYYKQNGWAAWDPRRLAIDLL